MKLFLLGGAEVNPNSVSHLIQLINDVLAEIKPKQLLHIPYARNLIPKGEESLWPEGWVATKLNLDGIELLDARNEGDLARAANPIIFMNGGTQRDNLYNEIVGNQRLHDLVLNTQYLIGESAGSMVCGEYRRTYQGDRPVIARGLGILKNTLIEPHYTQRDRHQLLKDEMKASGVHNGIGIDSESGIVVDTITFPQDYQVIGTGRVELIDSHSM